MKHDDDAAQVDREPYESAAVWVKGRELPLEARQWATTAYVAGWVRRQDLIADARRAQAEAEAHAKTAKRQLAVMRRSLGEAETMIRELREGRAEDRQAHQRHVDELTVAHAADLAEATHKAQAMVGALDQARRSLKALMWLEDERGRLVCGCRGKHLPECWLVARIAKGCGEG